METSCFNYTYSVQFVNTADSYAMKLIWVLNYLLQQQNKILRGYENNTRT